MTRGAQLNPDKMPAAVVLPQFGGAPLVVKLGPGRWSYRSSRFTRRDTCPIYQQIPAVKVEFQIVPPNVAKRTTGTIDQRDLRGFIRCRND